MDLSKINEIFEQALAFIDGLKELQDNYLKSIDKSIKDLQKLIDSNVNSDHYINSEKERISKKIDKDIENFKINVDKKLEGIQKWYDSEINSVKKDIVINSQAALGIKLPDSAAEKMAESIPHPKLSIPEFKIEIPELPNIK